MSFILDALKRADAERAHGRVPGLHAQAIPLGRPTPALRQKVRPYLLLLSGVVIALLCLALWDWLKPSFAASTAPPAPIATVAAPAAAATPPATPASAPPSAPATQASPSTPSTNTLSALKIPIAAKTPAKPAATAERPRERRAQPLVAAPTTPPASPNPSPSPSRTLNELPEDIRQALPKLVISGSIYSETAAHRMLIINGQVFREGEKPAPGLELEQIKPKTAVFNFKGQRYSVGY